MGQSLMYHKPRILMVLPNYMASRNILFSGVGAHLAKQADIRCITPSILHERLKKNKIPEGIVFEGLPVGSEGFFSKIEKLVQHFLPNLGYGGLAFRFNKVNGFVGHRLKSQLSKEQQAREAAAGNFVSAKYGWPFSRSQLLYKILNFIYWSPWWFDHLDALLDSDFRPDVVYLGQIQLPGMRDIILSAQRKKIPLIANIASWDQPTTKGPIFAGLNKYLVQSDWMKSQLIRFHGIDEEQVIVAGWPQMDGYTQEVSAEEMASLRQKLGIPYDKRVVLFGLYSDRLGSHEPAFVQSLSLWAQERNAHIILRPHPRDTTALKRFGQFSEEDHITLIEDGLDDLITLRNQILISDVVLTSGGTIALDATALSKPVIFLSGLDEDLEDGACLSATRYHSEHLASVVETGAIPLAHTSCELEYFLERFLEKSTYLLEQRRQLKALHLNPFDGQSSRRMAESILGVAQAQIK